MAQEEGSQAVVGEEEAEDSAVVSVSGSEEEQDGEGEEDGEREEKDSEREDEDGDGDRRTARLRRSTHEEEAADESRGRR